MWDHEAKEEARRKAVRHAQAVLNGQLGILEGCVALAEVADRVVPAWFDDPDFAGIVGIASECEGIPLGDVRHQWKGQALERMDAEAHRYADQVRDVVVKACENIVSRFGDRDDDQFSASVV
jgi:hypothetical protein